MTGMDNGWQASAHAWIADMGEHGDFSRRYVLDPVMLPRALARSPRKALDVGCGEGRFCRMLRHNGISSTGIDPTPALIATARARDPGGIYIKAEAERLPFRDEAFDLVISYLSLIDIPDAQAAIQEMVRVLQPGGALLIANLNSFTTACADAGWVKDHTGQRLFYPVDRYLQQHSIWIGYRDIRILNYHRPMSIYMRALLDEGLKLVYFDEPAPIAEAPPEKAETYRRVPWFVVMQWLKAA
jgi:SAM-dependent methyltransferase